MVEIRVTRQTYLWALNALGSGVFVLLDGTDPGPAIQHLPRRRRRTANGGHEGNAGPEGGAR